MEVPENGFSQTVVANALTQSSRLDYQLDLLANTNYTVWLRMRMPETTVLGTATGATQTLAPTSAAATAVGDLVVVSTWSFVTNNAVITHTLQPGFTQILSSSLDDGSADARLSIAFKVATVAGAQTYQAYTSSAGTSFTGLVVLKAGTFDITLLSSGATASAVNDRGPNPPAVGPVATPSIALVFGGWHFNGASGTIDGTLPAAPAAKIWETLGNQPTEFLAGDQFVQANATVDPGQFTSIGGSSGNIGAVVVIGLKNRSVFLGLNQGVTAGNATVVVGAGQTQWVPTTLTTGATAGTYTLSMFLREDGTFVDTIAVSRQNTNGPTLDNAWAYQTNPRTPQDQTCNADPFDTDPLIAGDQDGVLATGTLPACFANHAGQDAFDMSGNVKEWTLARAANQNPLRGGASDNEVIGTTCQINFSLADDTFFFPNVGFRCCRPHP
jgi:hypothetical protein